MAFEKRKTRINVQEEAARRMALTAEWARANVRPDPHAGERRARAERRRETGEWIRGRAAWTHFFTLTFEWAVDEGEAVDMLWAWLKQIAREVVRDHVPVAYAVERGAGRYGRVHLHGLLAVPPSVRLSREDARRLWWGLQRATGFVRFVRYTDGRGGPWYIVKGDEWDFGTACPRRFARCAVRCAEDPNQR